MSEDFSVTAKPYAPSATQPYGRFWFMNGVWYEKTDGQWLEISPTVVESAGLTWGLPASPTEERVPEIAGDKPVELVNHPDHYNSHPAGIECIDVIEHFNLNVGNAVKYLWRAGLKPGNDTLQDLKKALWYVNREIERLSSADKD